MRREATYCAIELFIKFGKRRGMKVLQIISHYLPAIAFGGPLQVAHGLGVALVDAGHEVTVCTTNMKTPELDLNVIVGEACVIDGVRVIYEPVKWLRYWGFSFKLLKRIYREVAIADVILIHFHYQFASVIGGWCARRFRKPYIVFTHGSLNSYGMTAKNKYIKRMYLKLLEKENFKQSLFTAYHSEVERKQSYCFSENSAIVPIGIDKQLMNYQANNMQFKTNYPALNNRFILTYLGRLTPGKGIDLLLLAVRDLLDAGEKVSLVLIGGDERAYLDKLKKQIQILKLDAYVLFTGILAGDEKWMTLSGADIFVLPSRSEGTSIVTLEAMALGLPVVISDRVGLSQDILEHACGLVTAYDVHALTHTLSEMIHFEDRLKMGKNGAALVREKYNWVDIANKLLEKIEHFRHHVSRIKK